MESKDSRKSPKLNKKLMEVPKQINETEEECAEPTCQATNSVSDPDTTPSQSTPRTSSETFPGTVKPSLPDRDDVKEPIILSLPELELISMDTKIVEANMRLLELNRKPEANDQKRLEAEARQHVAEARQNVAEARQQVAEARQQAALEQKDSLLSETGEVINLAMLRGVKGIIEACDEETGEQSNILNFYRTRILLGLITDKFIDLQELRFHAEMLMQFLEERRSMLGDGRLKSKDPCYSPSIPKFSLRPIVKGLDHVMDKLHSFLKDFIASTRDFVKKYRSKSPELDANAFRDYTNQFFDLEDGLKELLSLLQTRRGDFDNKEQIRKEVFELEKQTKTFHDLLERSYFKFGKILYLYHKNISENQTP